MKDSEVGLLRLVAQRLAGPPAETPVEAVRSLVCAQAQDLPGALTSIALRTAGRSRAAVHAAFDAGEIVRSWPMRGTLHVVAAEDLGWMLPLGTPRSLAAAAKRRVQLGISDADLERAHELALATVPATRTELMTAWAELAPEKGRGYHMLARLAETGVLCFGPTRPGERSDGRGRGERSDGQDADGEPVIVAVDDWIRAPRVLERSEALGEWALRFFRGHGPASVADFSRWTSMPAADVKAGVAIAREHLARIDVGGVEHLMDPAVPDVLAAHRRTATAARLLPGFDEFVLGYADRSAVIDPAHFGRVLPGNNGVFKATLVVGGRIVATWRTVRGSLALDPVDPSRPLADRVTAAAEKARGRLPS